MCCFQHRHTRLRFSSHKPLRETCSLNFTRTFHPDTFPFAHLQASRALVFCNTDLTFYPIFHIFFKAHRLRTEQHPSVEKASIPLWSLSGTHAIPGGAQKVRTPHSYLSEHHVSTPPCPNSLQTNATLPPSQVLITRWAWKLHQTHKVPNAEICAIHQQVGQRK